MATYIHISGVVGTFNRRYRASGTNYYTIIIDTFDGRQFYAPENEFNII